MGFFVVVLIRARHNTRPVNPKCIAVWHIAIIWMLPIIRCYSTTILSSAKNRVVEIFNVGSHLSEKVKVFVTSWVSRAPELAFARRPNLKVYHRPPPSTIAHQHLPRTFRLVDRAASDIRRRSARPCDLNIHTTYTYTVDFYKYNI